MNLDKEYPLLSKIDSPDQLRELEEEQLQELAGQLRRYMIETVSKTGGHLAPSLGVVDLTIALHYIFNTPDDKIVWDVGHQAYAHKILTGRRDRMATLRQKDGVSGFPKRTESEYDAFGVGHSSTSISAALGMAVASSLQNHDRNCIAVIGDGAMTAGEAFEALDHAGDLRENLIVVLNDNNMSISENVGALGRSFAKIISGKWYSTVREGSKKVFQKMPSSVLELARKAEEHVKGMVIPGTLFEEMGFNYIGPVDGHDLPQLLQVLQNIQVIEGPKLLHVVTKKGLGYEPAEENPTQYHGVTPFDPELGVQKAGGAGLTYTQVFGKWLCNTAHHDPKMVAITPAMREGSGMGEFAQKYPDRFFDVAIAEQHAVTFAAGLACEGLKPVVAIYSTFLQRGYDQLMHDVALQNLPVLFAIDRAGIVGADGPTHNGCFDISYMRSLPNLVIMAPSNLNECYQMLSTGLAMGVPVAVRYPREKVEGEELKHHNEKALALGKSEQIITGDSVAILCFGALLQECEKVAQEEGFTLINMRFVKPLDEEMLLQLAKSHEVLVTVEDNMVAGGAGSAVNEFLLAVGKKISILNIGIPDQYVPQGSREQMLAEFGLDGAGIKSAINDFLEKQDCKNLLHRIISR
ncbi:MAG: 1-deoxy-D-xylulose-5-phosphate synthase [Gammaproteobacteria bacterium]|nr:MAG: 1-deoxy-D-xylulose-5-phosphate synthase [Gammaproteobacteria bacterium]